MKRRTQLRHEAFTLVEMLVATAIVVFLVVVLSQILSTTQEIWRTSEARTDPFCDARAALELMARELALATPNDKAPVLALQNICPAQSGDADGPNHNQQVYALLPTKNVDPNNSAINKSDLCAVGFYCTWDNAKHTYILRRHFLPSDAAFSRMQAAGLPATVAPATSVYAPSVPATTPAEDEDVAAYVWDFKVIPYEYAGSLNAVATYPITYNATLPQFLEISFKAISPQAARKLAAQEVGTNIWFDTASFVYRNQILPAMHEFKTRIKLRNSIQP